MRYRKTTSNYVVRLEKGELIMESLTTLMEQFQVKSGFLYGLGGALWAELGFYSLEWQEYEFTKIDELFEISNMTGNIARVDDEPFLHVHATVAGRDLQARAGHLKEAAVGGTVEVYITPFEQSVERVHDDEVGLKLLAL